MEKFSIRKRIWSFGYVWKGIWSFVSKEYNVWIYCMVIIIVIVIGFCFGIIWNEWIVIIFCFGVVLVVEGFNMVIERLVNFVFLECNLIVGDVKDIVVGFVLICVIVVVIVGIIIFMFYVFVVLLCNMG